MHSRKGPGSSLTRGKAFTGKVEGDRGNAALDMDTVRLLKTQDVAYVRTVANRFAKEAEELRQSVVLAREALGENDGEKIVFAEGVEERDSTLAGKRAGDEGEDEDADEDPKVEKLEAKLEKLETRLETAEGKLAAVRRVERELEVQQAKTAKTATSGGTTRKGKKLMVRKRKR